jgi:hypothetical protein
MDANISSTYVDMSAPTDAALKKVNAAVNAAAGAAKVATGAATSTAKSAANTLSKAANATLTASKNAAAVATTALEEAPFSMGVMLLILLGVFALVGLVWWFMNSTIYKTIKSDVGSAPTPSNNKAFADDLTRVQIPIADALMAEHRPILGSEGGGGRGAGGTAGENGLAVPDMRPADRLLLNFHVLGARLGGFLGNAGNGGLYAEDRAVELALRKGCRLFLLEIDYLERAPEVPVLVYRDEAGNNLARNTGSIGRVARSLKKHTKDQKLVGDDPLIVILYMRRLPGESASSKEALNFMGAVAAEIQPLFPYLYRPPSSGTNTEADIFKQPLETYANSVVVLTNADLSGFKGDNAVTITDARHLDRYVHARLYTTTAKGPIDGLAQPAAGNVAGAVVHSYDYYLTLPKADQKADNARITWTLAMTPSLDVPPSSAELDLLMDKLGVQGLVIDVFSDNAGIDNIYAPNRFKTFSYVPKPAAARMRPTPVAMVGPADSRNNTEGGVVVP